VKPHTWRVSMTVAVIASLLLGLAGVGLGVEDLRKINNINHTIDGLNASVAGFNASFAQFKTDAAVPAATMVLPAPGSTVAGAVLLDAAPVGTNVSHVTFVASGGTSQKVQIATGKSTLAGYGATWSSSSLPNGTYEIAAVAYNAEGKSSTSPAVTVTVKNP